MLTHKGTQTIETPRLILRKAQLSDAEDMYRNWASHPEVTKFLTWPAYASPETARERLQIWQEGYASPETYQWMIVPRDLGQTIGTISVVELDNRIQKAEIGYCIGSAWWHRGYTSEALSAVIDFLFAEVGFQRIAARHDTNNPHSGAVMQKCGMRYEGTLRQADWNNQGICDEAIYSLLRSEWAGEESLAMRTLFDIDTKDYDPEGPAFVRPSVRGIILRDGKVAMVHSLKYDYYKFPGGGIEAGETKPQALIREVLEESGLQVLPKSIREYGLVHRVQKSDWPGIAMFVQDNYYYLCDVQPEVQSQHLDDYEAEEHFTLEFVAPETAIQANRFHDHGPKDQNMLEREAKVLEILMREGYFGIG